MNKLKILVVSLIILGCIPVVAITTSLPAVAQSYNNEWEKIGEVSAITKNGYSFDGTLYVKMIAGKFMYKLVHKGGKEYAVQQVYNDSEYNACITSSGKKFYFNVPRWY